MTAPSTWAEAFAEQMDQLYARLNPGAPKTPRPEPTNPCDMTWAATAADDLDRWRQHRCGQPAPHPNRACVCRYCAARRGAGGRWPR